VELCLEALVRRARERVERGRCALSALGCTCACGVAHLQLLQSVATVPGVLVAIAVGLPSTLPSCFNGGIVAIAPAAVAACGAVVVVIAAATGCARFEFK